MTVKVNEKYIRSGRRLEQLLKASDIRRKEKQDDKRIDPGNGSAGALGT